jgi:hypothetical protein
MSGREQMLRELTLEAMANDYESLLASWIPVPKPHHSSNKSTAPVTVRLQPHPGAGTTGGFFTVRRSIISR